MFPLTAEVNVYVLYGSWSQNAATWRGNSFSGGDDVLEQFFFGGSLADSFDGGLRKSCRREQMRENLLHRQQRDKARGEAPPASK